MTLQGTEMDKSVIILGRNERVQNACAAAKALEEAGEFEAAAASLKDFWPGVGTVPDVTHFDPATRAEALLRAGTLSGWIGSAHQVAGAQELARDLITQSTSIYEQLGLSEKLAEAHVDLAICYLRSGALDEARVTLKQVVQRYAGQESEQKLRALLNLAVVEKRATRYRDALEIHTAAAPAFEKSNNHALRGKFHNEFATVLKNLGLAEHREDYIDRALVEYAAASIHFEEAGHKRFLAAVENNLGFLFTHLRKFDEAQRHLDRARLLFEGFKDQSLVAQTDDTRAKALLAQGRVREAEAIAARVVKVFKEGDEQSLLAAALITHGTALARLGRKDEALSALNQSIKVAEAAGDPDSGGIAALTVVEEIGSRIALPIQHDYYCRAESLLAHSQHPGIQFRLGATARKVIAAECQARGAATELAGAVVENGAMESTLGALSGSDVVSLEAEVLQYEGNLIRRALEASGGSVTRAARMLGVTHQGLAFILNGRHKSLLSARKPVKHRRRSIIKYH